ncbi:MAG: translesion DNA synthesis-associated protein ImuA [Acidiferrobacteraceae bacterium]
MTSPRLVHPALWRGGCPIPAGDRLSTGFPVLDGYLGGGWPLGALTEIEYRQEGIGEVSLLLPGLAAMSQKDRWILWVAPPYLPYPPALVLARLRLSHLLWIEKVSGDEALWAVEQSLQSSDCGAVLFWEGARTPGQWRRLHQAAARGGGLGIWLHPAGVAGAFAPALRLGLEPAPSQGSLMVSILKRRGGWPRGPLAIRPVDPDIP